MRQILMCLSLLLLLTSATQTWARSAATSFAPMPASMRMTQAECHTHGLSAHSATSDPISSPDIQHQCCPGFSALPLASTQPEVMPLSQITRLQLAVLPLHQPAAQIFRPPRH